MNKVRTIVAKEWAEVFKNQSVLFLVIFMPLLLTLLPLGILIFAIPSMKEDDLQEIPPQFVQLCGQLAGAECMQVFLSNQFMILFMLIPLTISVSFAAYSIVGEKTTRCLEPLLATPITTAQLLTGKSLAAALPAILASWASFTLFAAAARLIVTSAEVYGRLVNPTWLLLVLLVGPLLAILGVNLSLIVSSRVNDPHAAQQISMIVIIPVMAVFFGQLVGLILLDLRFVFAAAVILASVDVALIYLGVRLFERETILTRWK
jgi:ABC-2 type transport system permease protein